MKAEQVSSVGGVWFRCKGCGQVCCYFEHGNGPHYPPGAVGHGKPIGDVNRTPAQCLLWLQSDAAGFWALHVDAERVEPPTSFVPKLTNTEEVI